MSASFCQFEFMMLDAADIQIFSTEAHFYQEHNK